VSEPRYAIGVDLGTTHCALSYVDLEASDGELARLAVFQVPQLYAPGTVEETPLLPSFLYLPHHAELAPGDLDLPWAQGADWAVGAFARDRGAQTPLRLVSSAKSWLCHQGADRRGAILPPDAPEEVGRLSPLEASIRYLRHLRDAWDAANPQHPLEEQELIVTMPASFDPAARELTAEAAEVAGYRGATLLEEPQAGLYSWLQATGPSWREQVTVGDVILVIDVGGGTTDLSLIAVAEEEGALVLHRVAVGEHILLGGDNMDLALAHLLAAKLAQGGTALDPWQVRALAHACRVGKEALLSDPELESAPLVVPSRSSRLIGGTIRAELTREEVAATILEGFFPRVDIAAAPAGRARTGLTQLGLPYAQDPAVSRHLAAFLRRQSLATAELKGFAKGAAPEGTFLHPTAVLFNGGVFKAGQLQERVAEVLNGWLVAEDAPPARILTATDLDLAVASGAAYYGYVRRGGGVRIRGGTAQSFYVGVESSAPAVPGIEPPVRTLCLAPFGMEEGTQADLPQQEFGLVVGEPVRFRFFGSSVRREDQVGALHETWAEEEIEELEEIQVKLPAKGREPGTVVPVRLRAAVTESGVLRLEALPREGRERWKVEFNTRGG
jgi:molecular chaperone DnaK (HSP70)